MVTTASAEAALHQLAELWQLEKLAARQQERELRDARPFAERVRRGLALRSLRYEETVAEGGGRCQLWFGSEREGEFDGVQIKTGDLVVLWSGAHDRRQSGVVGARNKSRLSIVVDADYDSFVEKGDVRLDLEPSEVTFERGEAAIAAFLADESLHPVRELFFGDASPSFGPEPKLMIFDSGLNDSQRQAVSLAMRAKQVALIHGPPGTGKTRTLVEVVRQQLFAGRRILVTAASNAAVDHLTRQLIAAKQKPLRLGHSARVAEDLRAHTAEAKMEKLADYRMARRWQAEARALREQFHNRKARGGGGSRGSGRALLAQANQLNADARRSLRHARSRVLARADIVCTTAAGADSKLLGNATFDVVVLDEATQAADPIALAALQRAPISVLAGDPRQLPPTVVDAEAARRGLASTLFERASRRFPSQATHLLTVQYRMSEALLRFPSESMYEGRLIADASVARRTLEELEGVMPDAERSSSWLFLDSSGMGWEEQVEPESQSTFNTAQAERTAAEVRRLLERGLPATEIAAITPYGAQVRLLRRLLADAVEAGLEIGSVDGFQGREKEAVVVDLVRSNDSATLGFLGDVRRTNVALTRAKRYLVIIGDGSTLASHEYYDQLLAAAQRDGVWRSTHEA